MLVVFVLLLATMIKYIIFLITAFYTNSIDAAGPECGILNLIPFSQWSGDASKRAEDLKTPVALVVIQHTVSPTCDTDDACKKILLDIREKHIKELNFSDIGNSFYIGGNGAIYEGAGWRQKGAHTLGYNDKSIGISFIGDFSGKYLRSWNLNNLTLTTFGLFACYFNI